jgi:hypothetical protein
MRGNLDKILEKIIPVAFRGCAFAVLNKALAAGAVRLVKNYARVLF